MHCFMLSSLPLFAITFSTLVYAIFCSIRTLELKFAINHRAAEVCSYTQQAYLVDVSHALVI